MIEETILEKLKIYGVGRRSYGDELFCRDKPMSTYGIYDLDDEDLCHEVIKTVCSIPGCKYTTESLLDFENHYNTSHRYACSQCKKKLPSPHLLDLHIQENHDSFFSVLALRKPSYSCYIEDCKEKFMKPEERHQHCIEIHKLPKDYRFEQESLKKKSNKQAKKKNIQNKMDIDLPVQPSKSNTKQQFAFTNSKQKCFHYSGKKFTENKKKIDKNIDIDEVMEDLKDSLPT